jgi:hypothetical protein
MMYWKGSVDLYQGMAALLRKQSVFSLSIVLRGWWDLLELVSKKTLGRHFEMEPEIQVELEEEQLALLSAGLAGEMEPRTKAVAGLTEMNDSTIRWFPATMVVQELLLMPV